MNAFYIRRCCLSPVRGGNPLGPGATKASNSGISDESELELATGPALRPRLVTLGRAPVGTGGGSEGVGVSVGVGSASFSDMVVTPNRMTWLKKEGKVFFLCVQKTLHFLPFYPKRVFLLLYTKWKSAFHCCCWLHPRVCLCDSSTLKKKKMWWDHVWQWTNGW